MTPPVDRIGRAEVKMGGMALRGAPVALPGLLLALLLSACISAPAPVQTPNLCDNQFSLTNPGTGGAGGIGGTGAPRAGVASGEGGGGGGSGNGSGGIGGTGIQAAKPVFGDGGIGGTGVVGVITGFASICVNGLEVQYDATTPVWDNGLPASANQLAVGQVVSLTTAGSAAQPRARGIAVIHALVGPLSSVNASTGQLVVMGQKATAQQPADLAGLRVGDWVRVSGHRLAGGDIVATKVQAAAQPAGALAQVRGPVTAIQGNTVKVGDTSIQLDAAVSAGSAGLSPGQEVWASGGWNGRVLVARQLVVQPTRTGLGRIEKVVLEGYVYQLGPREISLGFEPLLWNEQVQLVGGTPADLAVNRRVQINGRVGPDQRITVERLEFNPSPGGGDGSGRGRGSSGRGGSGSNSGKGSSGSGSGSSGSGSSGSGSSGSGSSGSGNSGSGSSGSGSSGTGSSGSGSSGSGSSGSGGSGSGK